MYPPNAAKTIVTHEHVLTNPPRHITGGKPVRRYTTTTSYPRSLLVPCAFFLGHYWCHAPLSSVIIGVMHLYPSVIIVSPVRSTYGGYYGLVVVTPPLPPRPQTLHRSHDNLIHPYRIASIFYL